MSRKIPATTYALVGLLSLGPWTTYELARQADRSLRWFFPRAERGIYQEAKRMVALGWASTETTWSGSRRSTTYAITPAGQSAFDSWLAERPAPLQLESEGVMKTFLAGPGRLSDVRANVDAIGDDARAALEQLAAMARQWQTGDAAFRERGPTNAITMRLIADLHDTIATWSAWATEALEHIEAGDRRGRRLADDVYDDIATRPSGT